MTDSTENTAAGGPERDAINLRLSEASKSALDQLVKDGYFAEMKDAYRLGIAYALRHELIDPADGNRSVNYLNVGSLDPQGALRDVVIETFGDQQGPPYKVIERLAEAGVSAISEVIFRTGTLEAVLEPAKT